MPQPKKVPPMDPAVERQQRVDAVMNELRPKLDAMLQKMAETIVNKPEAEELGTVEFELRDMGCDLRATVQATGLKSRKNRRATVGVNRVACHGDGGPAIAGTAPER